MMVMLRHSFEREGARTPVVRVPIRDVPIRPPPRAHRAPAPRHRRAGLGAARRAPGAVHAVRVGPRRGWTRLPRRGGAHCAAQGHPRLLPTP